MGFETQSVCSNERCQYGTVLYTPVIMQFTDTCTYQMMTFFM